MSLTYVGEYSIGGAVPGASAAATAGTVGINGALPDLTARIAGLQAALAAPPPPVINFAAQLALAEQIVTSITNTLAAVPPFPPVIIPSAQLAALNTLLTELLATLSAVNVQLSICTQVTAFLAHAELHAYAYAGPVNGLGGEVSTALSGGLPGGGGGADGANAIVLITSAALTWAAMTQIFKVTP